MVCSAACPVSPLAPSLHATLAGHCPARPDTRFVTFDGEALSGCPPGSHRKLSLLRRPCPSRQDGPCLRTVLGRLCCRTDSTMADASETPSTARSPLALRPAAEGLQRASGSTTERRTTRTNGAKSSSRTRRPAPSTSSAPSSTWTHGSTLYLAAIVRSPNFFRSATAPRTLPSKFGLSQGRISQLRREFASRGSDFTASMKATPRSSAFRSIGPAGFACRACV